MAGVPYRRNRGRRKLLMIGAGDGNRTHAIGLGSRSSTIELHPHKKILLGHPPPMQPDRETHQAVTAASDGESRRKNMFSNIMRIGVIGTTDDSPILAHHERQARAGRLLPGEIT